jgi:hypothetical protein
MMHRSTVAGFALLLAFGMGLSEARAETLTLKNGDRLEVQVVRAIGNTLAVKLPGRGMRQLPINAIDQIEIQLSSGEPIIGRLVGWSANVFEVRVDDRLLSVKDGEVLQTVAIRESGAKDSVPDEIAEEPADSDIAVAIEPATDLVKADTASTEPVAPDESEPGNGIGGPRIAVQESLDGESAVAARDTEDSAVESGGETAIAVLPSLTSTTLPTDENAGEIAIHFVLSEAVDRPIAVLYSAVDGSALSGADFQAQAGVLTIQAGAKSVDVKIPLIDDDQPEELEEFRLFLSVDPNAVSMASRHVTATLRDDD